MRRSAPASLTGLSRGMELDHGGLSITVIPTEDTHLFPTPPPQAVQKSIILGSRKSRGENKKALTLPPTRKGAFLLSIK